MVAVRSMNSMGELGALGAFHRPVPGLRIGFLPELYRSQGSEIRKPVVVALGVAFRSSPDSIRHSDRLLIA